jgi:hypothetical protein
VGLSFRRGLWLAVYGLAAAFVLSGFLIRYPLPDPTAKLIALAGAAFLFIGAYGAGTLVMDRLRIETTRLWSIIVSVATGLGILSVSTLVIGWIPVGTLTARLGFLQLVWGLFFLKGITHAYGLFHQEKPKAVSLPLFSAFCMDVALAAAAVCALSAFSPITYYDSLVYHLALPSYYLIQGKIAPAVFNLYSFFPANTEMLYLFILGRFPEPESIINLVTFGFSILTAATLFDWLREEFDDKTAWLSVALWATMPAVMLLSVGGYIEIPLAFYSLMSLRAFSLYLNLNHDRRWLLLSGLFGGFACATKYTGAITPLFLGLYLIWNLRADKKNRLSTIFLFGLAIVIPVFPWLLRNAVAIGNPVFPFFYRFLGGNVGWTAESAGAYFEMLTEYGARSSVFFELLSAPFDIAWNAVKFGGGFDTVGDFGWLLFIIATPMGISLAWKSPQKRWMVFYLLFHFVFWFLTKPVLRFLVGVLPIAVFFSAIALKKTLTDKNRLTAYLTLIFVAIISISNVFLYFFINDVFKPFQVPLGNVDRDTYLTKRLSFYEAYKYLNNTDDKNRRVFLLGEQRAYHLRIPYVSASIFAPSPIAKLCNNASNWTALDDAFYNQGITHVLVHNGEIERLGGIKKFGFTDQGELILKAYLSENCLNVFDKNRVSVFQIKTLKPR